MPTIANFPGATRPYSTGDVHAIDSTPAPPPSAALRIRVAVKRDELTRELAEGADPDASPELALRAAQLSSARSRKQLARTLLRTLADAHRPPMTRSRVVIIRRDAVLEAEGELSAMRERLAGSEPVRAEGMAIAEQIITRAESSPLYNRAERGALGRLLVAATEAMGPGSAPGSELPLAR